jgi:hypothetical protein
MDGCDLVRLSAVVVALLAAGAAVAAGELTAGGRAARRVANHRRGQPFHRVHAGGGQAMGDKRLRDE